jgi:hypothetical protein
MHQRLERREHCVERTYHRRRRLARLGRLTRIEFEMIMIQTAAA